MTLTSLPSPAQDGFSVFGVHIYYYALCILLGVFCAFWLALRRGRSRGLSEDFMWSVLWVCLPLGIVGARLYHVLITAPDRYLTSAEGFVEIFNLRAGGLGIMGGVAAGAAGAWFVCRRHRVPLPVLADVLAPCLLLAQAIGRWGNWFNQELFGRPTDLPWGLRIDPASPNFPDGLPADTLFHPTFLYESLWNLAGVVLLIVLERRLRLDGGRLFALYLVHYGTGRMLIELFLRIDPSLMVLGQRVHVWTSLGLVLLGLVLFVAATLRRRRARGGPVEASRA